MKNKEPTHLTPEQIAIQLKEFGEALGFNIKPKKCNKCLSCKCKTPKKDG